MKCDKVLPQLSDYIDELLTTEDKSLLEEHMKQCSSCANELQKLSKTVALVRSLPKMSAPINLQQEISKAIAPTPWLKIYKSLSLAAGLLLSFVLGMWFVIFQNPERFATESAVAKSQDAPQKTTPKIQKQSFRNEEKRPLNEKQSNSPELFGEQRNLRQKKVKQKYSKDQVEANKNTSDTSDKKEIAKVDVPGNMARKNNSFEDKGTQNETVETEMDDFVEDVAVEMDYEAGGTTQTKKAESQTSLKEETKDNADLAEMDDDSDVGASQGAGMVAQEAYSGDEGDPSIDDVEQILPRQPQKPKSKNDQFLFSEKLEKTEERKRRDRQEQTSCNKCHVENTEAMHEQLVEKVSLKTLYKSLSNCNKCHMILDEAILRQGHVIPKTTITSLVDDQNGKIAEQIFIVQKMVQLEYALRGLAEAKGESRLSKYTRRVIAVAVSTLRKSDYIYHEKYVKPALVKVVTARLHIGNSKLHDVADFVKEQAQSITLLPIQDLNNIQQIPVEEVTEDEVFNEEEKK